MLLILDKEALQRTPQGNRPDSRRFPLVGQPPDRTGGSGSTLSWDWKDQLDHDKILHDLSLPFAVI